MKKFLIAVLAVFSFSAIAADEVVITSGQKGLTYNSVYGMNLASALGEFSNQVRVDPSKGSLDNLNKVAAGEAQIGFTQADAYQYWRSQNPNEAQKVDIAGVLGQECIWVAVKKDGKIKGASDLGNGAKIAVGDPTTGSYASWQYLQQLVKGYSKAETYAYGGQRALGKVNTGELDAFLWVSAPGKDNKFLDNINKDSSNLELIDMSSWSVNDKLPNGSAVYTKETVKTDKSAFFGNKKEVPCTTTLVVVNVDSGDDLIESLAGILMSNKNRITGTKE